jgi:hypothetical protein
MPAWDHLLKHLEGHDGAEDQYDDDRAMAGVAEPEHRADEREAEEAFDIGW